MNRDDIIRMAREAGMYEGWDGWTTGDDPNCLYPECVYTENLERFAALVAAAEREACAKICDAADKSTHSADLADSIRARGQA